MRLVALLLICAAATGCGLELKAKTAGNQTDVRGNLTGLTPAQTSVSGTTVDAKISVTPSSQVVRGLSVGAKISVQ